MRRSIVFAIIATALLVVGCKKKEVITPPSTDRTFLHVMSAVPQDTFDFKFDYLNADDVVIKAFVFNRNFPFVGYADLLASGTPDEFGNGKLYVVATRQPFIDLKPDTLMPPREIVLGKDEHNTICLADSASKLRFLKIKDDAITYASDTTTAVRFINLSNDLPTASLGSSSGSITIQGVDFWKSSAYSTFPHGQYDVELHDATGTVISSVTLWLSGRTAYSFFAVGGNLAYFTN
jgi:hypothetical protein